MEKREKKKKRVRKRRAKGIEERENEERWRERKRVQFLGPEEVWHKFVLKASFVVEISTNSVLGFLVLEWWMRVAGKYTVFNI